MPETSRYIHLAEIMKALAHPSRLLIVDKLSQREHCVCELQELICADMSTVSRHLAVLRNAGIIGGEKRQNWVYYRLLLPCVLEFYTCLSGKKGTTDV